MIKLGEAYFDEASIVAITPKKDSLGQLFYAVEYGTGFYVWCAEAEEVQQTLERFGLIEPAAPPVQTVFTPDEIATLRDALYQGYYYAARDSNEQIYAYRDLPRKGKGSWLAAISDTPQTLRLHGEFAALSWDDESPLIIEVALAGTEM